MSSSHPGNSLTTRNDGDTVTVDNPTPLPGQAAQDAWHSARPPTQPGAAAEGPRVRPYADSARAGGTAPSRMSGQER